jgi:hypothetical protein
LGVIFIKQGGILKRILKFLSWFGVAVGAYFFLGLFSTLFLGLSPVQFLLALFQSFGCAVAFGVVCILVRWFRARRVGIEIASSILNSGKPRLKYACISCKEQYARDGFCSNLRCKDFARKLRKLDYELVEQE